MSSQLEVRAMNGSSIRVASGRQFKGTLALRTRRALALALVVGAHAAAPSTAAAQPSAAETKQPQIAIPSIAPDLKQQLERLGGKLDLSLTGFAQGQATGTDGSGRFDALLELDSTRLGLWPVRRRRSCHLASDHSCDPAPNSPWLMEPVLFAPAPGLGRVERPWPV
jgi:hypothetical protein